MICLGEKSLREMEHPCVLMYKIGKVFVMVRNSDQSFVRQVHYAERVVGMDRKLHRGSVLERESQPPVYADVCVVHS